MRTWNYGFLVRIPVVVLISSSIKAQDTSQNSGGSLWPLPSFVYHPQPWPSTRIQDSNTGNQFSKNLPHSQDWIEQEKDVEIWSRGKRNPPIGIIPHYNNQQDTRSVIEGTGPFQCSFEQDSNSQTTKYIKNIGPYKCYFPFQPDNYGVYRGSGFYECFFGKNLQKYRSGSGYYNCQFWQTKSLQLLQEKIGRQGQFSQADSDLGEIEGTGSYLCIFQGSDMGGQVFVRDVGNFHCNFQGGQRTQNMVVGFGFYQCHFQKPGDNIRIRAGIGLYICFLAGVRRVKGLDQEITPPNQLGEFVEFLGSVKGTLNNSVSAARPRVELELLGLYQFGPIGKGLDVCLLQALESYDVNLQNEVSTNDQNEYSGVLSSVSQLGQFQFAFKGTGLSDGRRQFNRNLGYNFRRTWSDRHSINFMTTVYDYMGQTRVLGQNEDFVQNVLYYEYENPENFYTDVQLTGFTQFDLHSGQIDWFQLIFKFDWDFLLPEGNRGYLELEGVLQGNNERSLSGEATDLFLGICILEYIIPGTNDRQESGLFRMTAIYNYYLELEKERAGWIQMLVTYDRNFPRNDETLLSRSTQGSVSVVAVYEVNFPNIQLTNSMWNAAVNYVIDLNALVASLRPEGSKEGEAKQGGGGEGGAIGRVTISGMITGLSFGFGREAKYVYYIILYVLYEVNVEVGDKNSMGGQRNVRLLMRLFQEVRNDNIAS